MQEAGRLSIIMPVLLRCWLTRDKIQLYFLKAAEMTMPKDLNAVDGIVKCYAAMARSNTVVLSPMIAPEDRHAMDSLLQESCKAFQRLFKCASFAVSPKFQKEGFLPLSRAPSPFNGNGSQASDIRDTDAEDSADMSGSEAEYDAMAAQITTVTGKGSKKATFFHAFLARPVVHVALHLEDVAAEYATPSNCTTFTGEDKHRCGIQSVTE